MQGEITSWQLWLAMGMPTLMSLLGILFNRRDAERLEDRLNRRIDGIDKRLDTVDKRLDVIDGRVNQQTQVFHQDVISLLKMHQEHDLRLARIEQR